MSGPPCSTLAHWFKISNMCINRVLLSLAMSCRCSLTAVQTHTFKSSTTNQDAAHSLVTLTFHNPDVPPSLPLFSLSLPLSVSLTLPWPLSPSFKFQASLTSELSNTHQTGQTYSSFHSSALVIVVFFLPFLLPTCHTGGRGWLWWNNREFLICTT